MIDLDKPIQYDVTQTLKEVAESDSIVKNWENTTYGDIQRITNPKKGDFGEKIIAYWLNIFGYGCEVLGRERKRGGNNVDLLVDLDKNNKKVRVEVKLASLDSQKKYQFSWIPVDYNYALIIFIGINPLEIYLAVKTKDEIKSYINNPTRGKTLTPVPTKNNPTHRKWTTSSENADMVEIKTYRDIKKILDSAIKKYIKYKK